MPAAFRVVGFARREKTDAAWRTELREALNQFSRRKPVDDAVWTAFAENIFYCQGDLTDPAGYKALEQKLSSFKEPKLRHNLVFYLATQPSQLAAWPWNNCTTPGCCTRIPRRAGNALVVGKNPSATTLARLRRGASTTELTRFTRENQVLPHRPLSRQGDRARTS